MIESVSAERGVPKGENMNRERCLEEMIASLFFGGIICMIALALLHKEFVTPAEVIGFWISSWMIATYVVWSVIDWTDRRRG